MKTNKNRRAMPWRAAWIALSLLVAFPTAAQPRFEVELEGGAVLQTRNDAQIPNDGAGTRFSLVDLIGNDPFAYARGAVRFTLTARHSLRLTYAPLRLTEAGMLEKTVDFAGGTFLPGTVEGTYQFNSPRLTYRYLVVDGDRARLGIGFTGLVRDAEIRLVQGSTSARDTDVGFVPLLHLYGAYAFAPRWWLVLDFDGLAAPQGRAFDGALKVQYALSERLHLALGYRTLEGGADSETVYNFAWFHYAVGGITLRF